MRFSKRLSLYVALLLLLTLSAYSQTLPKGVQKVTSVEGITEYAYPNGLHVLLFPDPASPKLTVNVTYLVGSRHEGYGETGMAHLLEHMLFLRTRTDRDVKKELTSHGASWNGSTSEDRTNYFETVTASDENLRWALGLEAERMTNMRMEKALLDTEMTVVRNEFEMGENSPIRILYQRTLEAAYTFHNYGKSTIGNRSDIENVPIERLAAFYQKYYQPDNAVLTIAGQFDESKALANVMETLGSLPHPSRTLEKTYTVEPTQDGERIVRLRRVGDQQAIVIAYHVPAAAHSDAAALEVLAVILGENYRGRLYKALVDSRKAIQTGFSVNSQHDPGMALATVLLRTDQPLDDARETALTTIDGIISQPPSKEEVAQAKARILKQLELGLTNTESVGLTLSEPAAWGDWRLLFYLRDEIKKVTEQDVLRVAKAYLKSSNRTLGEFIPTKSPDRAEIPATPDPLALLRDYKGEPAMAQGEVFVPTPANIEGRVIRKRLPNGLRVVMLPKKNRGGTVTASLSIEMGDEKSLLGQEFAADMAGAMLIRGTKEKNREQIQSEMDRLKAQINAWGGTSNAGMSILTTEPNFAGALRLGAEIVRRPAFAEAEFEQVRQRNLAGLEANKSEPSALASIAISRHLNPYPKDDFRCMHTIEESIEGYKSVTLDSARKFYEQYYGASNARFVIAGQFNPDEVIKLLTELFGDWKSSKPYARVVSHHQQAAALAKTIETPDKQNAVFAAGMNVKMSSEDPDYAAALIANYIFGGSGDSRLFRRVRNKEGLSYSVGSGLSIPDKDDNASFSVYAISAPQNAPKVEAIVREELEQAVRDGFTAEEVNTAKKAWLDLRLTQRAQDSALLSTLSAREKYDRTMKWDEQVEARVAALTQEQVNSAFRRLIIPANLSVVQAGDFAKAGVYQAKK